MAISGLLSAKEKSSVGKWVRIYRSLGAELEGNDKLLSMNKIFLLSCIDLLEHFSRGLFFRPLETDLAVASGRICRG